MLQRQTWLANLVVGAAALGAVAAVGVCAWTWRPVARAARPAPIAVTGAFATGGAPAADPALAALLAEPLTQLVIATDQDRGAGGLRAAPRLALVGNLVAPPEITARGPALTRAWGEMIRALDRWVYVPRSGDEYDALVAGFKGRVRAVSDELARAGLGYYLEGDVVTTRGAAHAIVYSYRVEDVAFVLARGAPRRVLALRRLDRLNVAHAMMGMQSEDLGDPVVLLDQIDDHVRRKTLPLLAPGALYPMHDPTWAAHADAVAVRAELGAAVRAELLAALADPAVAAVAERYVAPADPAEPAPARADADAALADALARCRELVARSVRRHEAQHGLDDEDALAYPDALGPLVGPLADARGRPRDLAVHARNELSAYTSQIANDPRTPLAAYAHVVSFAFERPMWGTPESFAALALTAALVRHLAPDAAPAEVLHDGAIDRARLAAQLHVVVSAPPEALRDAARAAWRDLFGAELAPIVDR